MDIKNRQFDGSNYCKDTMIGIHEIEYNIMFFHQKSILVSIVIDESTYKQHSLSKVNCLL